MKNFALTATLIAALAAPSSGFAHDLFPNLVFPSDQKTTTAGQDLVATPITIKSPAPRD